MNILLAKVLNLYQNRKDYFNNSKSKTLTVDIIKSIKIITK